MAEIKPNYDTHRRRLADIIPLKNPFTIYIEQTKYCNFKCYYCMHSTHDKSNGVFAKNGHVMQHMDFEVYKKLISQLKELGVKRIVFSGLGEPLMNPRFPDFVKYAVDANIADRIEVITNAAMLTPEYTKRIIASGITNINISIQGINAETYEDVCDFKIDFNKFVDNIRYLFKNRSQAKIYIKCIDAILKTEEHKKKFYELFGNISDKIYIEHLVVMQQSMDILNDIVDKEYNMYGEKFDSNRQICAQCFYFLQVGVDGEVYPCSIPGLTKDFSIGNMNEHTLTEIWNGEKRKLHLIKMLEFKRDKILQCKNCSCFNCISDPLECLDNDAEKLIKYFR